MTNNSLFNIRNKCPICDSEKLELIINIPVNDNQIVDYSKLENIYSAYSAEFLKEYPSDKYSGFNFHIMKCNPCDFYFNAHTLSEEGMSLLYNNWLDQEALRKFYASMDFDINEKLRLDFLEKYFLNEINVLDFGAGFGNFLKLAKKKHFNLFAYDLSLEKNQYMADSLGIKLVEDLSKYENYFSYININQVLEHVSEPLKLIKSLKKCLTNDGILYASTPNCRGVGKLLKTKSFNIKMWNCLSPLQHINAFTNKSLLMLGKYADLTPFSLLKISRNTSFSKRGIIFSLKQIYHMKFATSIYFIKEVKE